ncbi:MAG: response regulator transcription factor [Deltaproteobacteria bacterium]|nr:MAG: response regulator transcription factor [Deltaproteobacteria bacterium]
MMPAPAKPLRVAIADDHALFRQGLISLLGMTDDVSVVAETDCAEAIQPMVAATPCDILLLDLQMERSSLIDIAAVSPQTDVIVVTASEGVESALAAIRAGAKGIVFKRFAVETLMDAIRTVSSGQVFMPAPLQTRLVGELREPSHEPLTAREREIVRHVAAGLRNSEIAAKLFISEETVKTHLGNIFKKVAVRDRVQLTRYALRLGMVGVHDLAS